MTGAVFPRQPDTTMLDHDHVETASGRVGAQRGVRGEGGQTRAAGKHQHRTVRTARTDVVQVERAAGSVDWPRVVDAVGSFAIRCATRAID